MPEAKRTARFYSVLVLLRHADDPQPLIARGRVDGAILDAPRGSGGFGYDPLFFVPALGRGAAELEPATEEPRQPSRPGARPLRDAVRC